MSTEKSKTQNMGQKTTEKIKEITEKLSIAIGMANEYKDLVSVYVNNPFYMVSDTNAVEFKVELENSLKIPKFLSYIVFGEQIMVNAIEIKGVSITLYFTNGLVKDKYVIELDNGKMPIMDIALLLFVFSNLSLNDMVKVLASIQDIKNGISGEKNELIQLLKENGIEINE